MTEVAALSERNELVRLKPVADRITPADKGFDRDHSTEAAVSFRSYSRNS